MPACGAVGVAVRRGLCGARGSLFFVLGLPLLMSLMQDTGFPMTHRGRETSGWVLALRLGGRFSVVAQEEVSEH